ncbi:histidine kinase, partial [Halorubrum sp. C3]
MDRLGISESIERKVVTAVGIQFLVTVGIFLVPFLVSGRLSYVLSGALFLGAVLAIYNTLLIVRSDFVAPLRQLESGADAIAAGEIDAVSGTGATDASGPALSESDQPDEIGSLVNSFVAVERY